MLTGLLAGSALAQAAAPATPRTADGKPNLDGVWAGGADPSGKPSGADNVTFAGRGGTFFGFEEDNGLNRLADTNKPIYLPKWWETIKNNDYMGNWEDPLHKCMPNGVPRLGAPNQIIHLPERNIAILFYQGGFIGSNDYRIVPTDGRAHNLANVVAETWKGDPVAHWEGDTLVIESVGFTDTSWPHKSGYIHGYNVKVIERLTRTGNQLRWEATVEDPEYLAEPWKMTPIVRNLVTTSGVIFLAEDLPCLPDAAGGEATLISHTRSG